jgi:hypothetical protein
VERGHQRPQYPDLRPCDRQHQLHQRQDQLGIGIGLAGSTYDNDYPEKQTVKNFVVANITGSNCRQLVHVENGKHFIIRNIKAKISPRISAKRRE